MDKLLPPLEAATILGVSYPKLKNWIRQGKVKSTKTLGGHSRVPESEILRLIAREPSQPEIETLRACGRKFSERNQLLGLVLEVKFDDLVAQVTLLIGKQRITSIITADSARELQLKPGVHAAALFKSTEVMMLRI